MIFLKVLELDQIVLFILGQMKQMKKMGSIRDIAGMISLPQGTVSWRLARAMKLLRKELEEEEATAG